jgi:hypothetical protein
LRADAARNRARILEAARAAQQAMAAEDPWEGFSSFLEQVCAMQAEDVGMCDVLTTDVPATQDLSGALERVDEVATDLIAHAHRARVLRADFTVEDLQTVLIANGAVVHGTRHSDPRAWRRHLSLVLDAARA